MQHSATSEQPARSPRSLFPVPGHLPITTTVYGLSPTPIVRVTARFAVDTTVIAFERPLAT